MAAWNPSAAIEDPIVRFPIRLVAPAGRGLESAPVEHGDVAAAVADQAGALQGTRRLGDADPADTEHQGQEFLRDVEGVGVRAILGHQQPAGEPRLDHVEARAGRRLRELAATGRRYSGRSRVAAPGCVRVRGESARRPSATRSPRPAPRRARAKRRRRVRAESRTCLRLRPGRLRATTIRRPA